MYQQIFLIKRVIIKKISQRGDNMNVSEVTANRITQLCQERNITVNKLCTISGITQSTVNCIVNHRVKNIGIVTIKKLCDGLEITITDFFDTPEFKELEQEMY